MTYANRNSGSRIHTYPAVKNSPLEAYLALAQFLQYQNNQVERLRIVREGIAGYPRYEGINQLKNIEKENSECKPFTGNSYGLSW